MKAFHVLLAVSFALALTPFADAEGECAESAPQEATIAHPLEEGKYLFIIGGDPTSPQVDLDKFGVWTETNEVDGLQTEKCDTLGIVWYRADAHDEILP